MIFSSLVLSDVDSDRYRTLFFRDCLDNSQAKQLGYDGFTSRYAAFPVRSLSAIAGKRGKLRQTGQKPRQLILLN